VGGACAERQDVMQACRNLLLPIIISASSKGSSVLAMCINLAPGDPFLCLELKTSQAFRGIGLPHLTVEALAKVNCAHAGE